MTSNPSGERAYGTSIDPTERHQAISTIVGFTAFAFEASELMVAMQTTMLGQLPYTVLRDAILTHPTMSEGLSQLGNLCTGRYATTA